MVWWGRTTGGQDLTLLMSRMRVRLSGEARTPVAFALASRAKAPPERDGRIGDDETGEAFAD